MIYHHVLEQIVLSPTFRILNSKNGFSHLPIKKNVLCFFLFIASSFILTLTVPGI